MDADTGCAEPPCEETARFSVPLLGILGTGVRLGVEANAE